MCGSLFTKQRNPIWLEVAVPSIKKSTFEDHYQMGGQTLATWQTYNRHPKENKEVADVEEKHFL